MNMNPKPKTAALLVALCCGFSRSTRAQDTPAEKAPAQKLANRLTQAELEAMRDRMQKLVEKHAGRRFRKKAKIELAQAGPVARRLYEEFLGQFRAQFRRSPKRQLERLAKGQASGTALTLLGKFDMRSKVLYVLPLAFDRLVKQKLLDAKLRYGLLELVVAHELVHALQDEGYDLNRNRYRGQRGMHAWQVVIEGHATFVQNEIAKELDLEDCARSYDELLLAKKNKAAQGFHQRYQRMRFLAYYYHGARFFDELVATKGRAAQWLPFDHPPKSAGFAFDARTREELIASWSQAKSEGTKEAQPAATSKTAKSVERLYDLNSMFGKRHASAVASNAGPTLLRSLFAKVPEQDFNKQLRTLEDACFLQCGTGTRLAVTIALRFSDEVAARRYVERAETWLRQELAAVRGVHVDEVGKLGQAASGFDFSSKKGQFGQSLGVLRWYRDGAEVVQIDATSFRLNEEKLDAIAKRAFELFRS